MTNPISGVPFRLFNTLGRTTQELAPEIPGQMRMYTCGPTVYAYAHLGNMRAYVCADLLRRALEWKGWQVRQVINITDVGHMTSDDDLALADGEDKLEAASRREGRTVWDIAEHYTAAFKEDLRLLNVQPPALWCKATDHIAEMIDFARRLQQKGCAYEIPSGLYLDVSQIPGYGALALLDAEGMREGARVAVAEGKRNPRDFALWRRCEPDSKRLMEWDSPWGRGIPGWHLECSVMSSRYLGEHFDLHTGGVDHIPIHHTNEIAQSEALLADGRPWVRHWFHNEFLVLADTKVSKSRGDSIRVSTIAADGFPPSVYRYFLLGTHYRSPATFSLTALSSARTGLRRLAERFARIGATLPGRSYAQARSLLGEARSQRYLDDLDAAVSDDLNTPRCLAIVQALSRDEDVSAQDLAVIAGSAQRLLGVDLAGATLDALRTEVAGGDIPQAVAQLLEAREEARARKDYAAADALRAQIAEHGYTVEDRRDGASALVRAEAVENSP